MPILVNLLFFLFFLGSMNIVYYYKCPGDVMPDKDKGGFMVFQFVLSIVTTFWLFTFFTEVFDLEYRFGDEDWQRILFVICLAFLCFCALGLLIEGFLILTHKDYRKWRFEKSNK